MINKVLIDAILKPASETVKSQIIKDAMEYVDSMYDTENKRQLHILTCLANPDAIVTVDDVNKEYLDNHKELIFASDSLKLIDYKIISVNNVGCYVEINYNYCDEDGHNYNNTININFINYPELINK